MALDKKLLEQFFENGSVINTNISGKPIFKETSGQEKYSKFKVFDSPEYPTNPETNSNLPSKELNSIEINEQGDSKKTTHKPNTNRTQSTHKPDTNQTQSTHGFDKTEHRTEHRIRHKPDTNRTQTTHKPDTNQTQSTHKLDRVNTLTTIIGLQRKVLLFIYSSCKKNRSHVSEPLAIINIASALYIRVGSIKTTIARLEKKGVLFRSLFKNGRGGWSTYGITETIFKELILLEAEGQLSTNQTQTEHKPDTKYTQTEHKVHTELNTEPNTTASSSSSFLNITTTDLLSDYDFDIQPLEKIGFTEQHLKQITDQEKLDLDLIQQSINHFAYDYESGHVKIKTNPINFFMGVLKKGNAYISEHYVDPQEEKRKLFLEIRRRQKEEKKEIEKELLRDQYNIWVRQLSEDEKKDIAITELPEHQKTNWFRYLHDMLEKHFEIKIWPEKRQETYEKADVPFIPLREIS